MDVGVGSSGTRTEGDLRGWVKGDETYYRSDALSLWDVFLTRYGLDCVSILQHVGIAPQALNTPNLFISWPRYCHFVETAALQSGDDNFGLRHALFLPNTFPNCGPLLLLAQFCGTFREWIEMGSRYAWVHTNAWVPHLSIDKNGNAVFRTSENPSIRMPRHVGEGLLLILLRVVWEISGRHDLAPALVRFHHPPPADTELHHRVFGCPIEFGALHNEFLFDPDYLDFPVGGNLSIFRALVDVFIKREIRRAARRYDRFSDAVAHAIPAVLGTDLLAAGEVANALGVSEKKMQRLLREEGTSFQKIASDVRKELALRLLSTSDIPLKVIGGYLGYKSNAAFTQAFTQWTGCPPSAYRNWPAANE